MEAVGGDDGENSLISSDGAVRGVFVVRGGPTVAF